MLTFYGKQETDNQKKKKKRKISERGNKNSEEQKLSYYLNQKVFG